MENGKYLISYLINEFDADNVDTIITRLQIIKKQFSQYNRISIRTNNEIGEDSYGRTAREASSLISFYGHNE